MFAEFCLFLKEGEMMETNVKKCKLLSLTQLLEDII